MSPSRVRAGAGPEGIGSTRARLNRQMPLGTCCPTGYSAARSRSPARSCSPRTNRTSCWCSPLRREAARRANSSSWRCSVLSSSPQTGSPRSPVAPCSHTDDPLDRAHFCASWQGKSPGRRQAARRREPSRNPTAPANMMNPSTAIPAPMRCRSVRYDVLAKSGPDVSGV